MLRPLPIQMVVNVDHDIILQTLVVVEGVNAGILLAQRLWK